MWPFGKKKKKPKKAKNKKRYLPRKEEHNFDEALKDEEFFDIMD